MKYKWNEIMKSFLSFFFPSYGQNYHKSNGLWEIHYLINYEMLFFFQTLLASHIDIFPPFILF